ncbi:MAG: GTPase Era [Candidatus Gottesmanbacteria bacterium GW2011_GWA1_43_11]|uniref:GTPase Era n=1 Tax=Candidatus Gottesmanbacteria bacterium GW2011_GWA1_43_11 TaxID=1618436 RepID=A0A0G1CJ08_9BACT|nr:MAG: GTPase Era [Candidatus Gottesmanbacteria bacterium GW2011_GWA1_43_11]
MKKAGVVLLVGRPNTGKSTLLNNLLGRKVAITSPKPQTTRFPIEAVYEDERGQIIFIDTPGVFAKVEDQLGAAINEEATQAIQGQADVVVYIIDPTRKRDQEENRTLGLVRKLSAPKILVVNKTDQAQEYLADYAFLENEFDTILQISALKRKNLNRLFDAIFKYLPVQKPLVKTDDLVQPALNLDSKLYIAELIREKAFLNLREEVPYTVHTVVDEISERPNGDLYIRGRIITTHDRYKIMIVGKSGAMIREIGMATRKELEIASGKKVYVDLTVEVNPHWMESV